MACFDLNAFQQDGFAMQPELLSREEIDGLISELETNITEISVAVA